MQEKYTNARTAFDELNIISKIKLHDPVYTDAASITA